MGCQGSKLDKEIDQYSNFEKIQPIMTVYSPHSRKNHKAHPKEMKVINSLSDTKKSKHNSKKSKIKSPNSAVKTKSPHKRNEKMKEILSKNCDSRIVTKYDIKGIIGKGSFSKVFRVVHRQNKQPYAIKIIDKLEGYEAFECEISILTRVNHPNVIKLIEIFESDIHIYMVMELATGGNLLDRLEIVGIFSEDEAKKTLKMVINGINYLHNLGITHRDLKPDNLLYYHPGRDSRLMITDFGFASTRKHNGNPYMHTICGTPQYLAPEIILRRPYTCSVDMWAIGIIMYIVLIGAFPFDAPQDAQIFKLILHYNPNFNSKPWKKLSSDSRNFISRLLCKDPDERLTSEEALEHPWMMRDDESTKEQTASSWHNNGSLRSSLSSQHHRVQASHLDHFLQSHLFPR